jgi:hypothetical protein
MSDAMTGRLNFRITSEQERASRLRHELFGSIGAAIGAESTK